MLQARIGDSLVLAHAGRRQLHILNAAAAELWRRVRDDDGCAEELAQWLTTCCAVDEDAARAHVESLVSSWRQAGLVGPAPAENASLPAQDWIIPAAASLAPAPGAMRLVVAGHDFSLAVADPGLRDVITPLVASMRQWGTDRATATAHVLCVRGGSENWTLHIDGEPSAGGFSTDEAVVAVLHALVDLACRAEERLLVVHGAGVVLPDGRGALLVAPGGSGKTTFAAALNASGWRLLNDDVVPVDLDGDLLEVRAPICVKSGGWPVLAAVRPDLATLPTFRRFSQPVRFLAPLGPAPAGPLQLGLFLFPCYSPDGEASIRPLTPEATLQRIVEAEAVIRNLTQAKLEALARWVGSAPSYALTYPDLDSALALVREISQGRERRQ